jgi:chemotaxis signal transduction protein
MTGDKLIFEVRGQRFGVDTSGVAGILEAGKTSAIPGQTGIIRGVISLRGDPVAVVDAAVVFTGSPEPRGARDKVVVVRDLGHLLGINIGPVKPYFVWSEELKNFHVTDEKGPYTKGRIETGEHPISIVDCTALFEEAARVLATDGQIA